LGLLLLLALAALGIGAAAASGGRGRAAPDPEPEPEPGAGPGGSPGLRPSRASNRGVRPRPAPPAAALSLARGEFSIAPAARPFVSPLELVWYGLPGEETAVARSFSARSDAYEDGVGKSAAVQNDTQLLRDQRWTWVQYVLHAMRDSKRWISESGVWGGKEWRALTALTDVLDEWIAIQEQVSALAARQILTTPTGAAPERIRSPEHWDTYSVNPVRAGREAPGLRQRWPVEVYVVSRSLLNELRWARAALGGDPRVAPGGLCDVIKGHVDAAAVNADGVVTAVTATAGGAVAMGQLYEQYKRSMAYLSGAPGLADAAGNPPTLGSAFPLFRDVVDFVGEVSGLMAAYHDLQALVVGAVRSVVTEVASTIGDALSQVETFVGTISDVGASIPFFGTFVQAVTGVVDVALRNAQIDAARRRERGVPTLVRGVDGEGRPLTLTRRDVETWALMMFRAMKLQEIRVAALVDGTSPLTASLRPKPVDGTGVPVMVAPVAYRGVRPR